MQNSQPAAGRAASAAGIGGTGEAYALLAFTAACWGGNAVAGRLCVGEVSPMVVTSLRWAIVSAILVAIRPLHLARALPELGRRWKRVALMAVCGYSIFNALFYLSAHYTSGVNIAILQGGIPIFVILGSILLQGMRIGPMQALGVAATLIGVATVATHGELTTLAGLGFNLGDGLMLIACFLYAGYTLALRDRPNVPALSFFTALAVIAFFTSLPLVAYEAAIGAAQWPTPKGWAVLAFIAIFPSFLAQLAFIRGVRLIGPGRAGLFANLVPIFGAFMAVMILGEPFGLYHFVALALTIGGILVAETAGRMRANAERAAAGDRPAR